MTKKQKYELPALQFLNDSDPVVADTDDKHIYALVEQVENLFETSGVSGEATQIFTGPVVTTIEYKPTPGVNLDKITGLVDKLALALKVKSIRMVVPIPGKNAIGIEIPNQMRSSICFRQIQTSDENQQQISTLNICLGLDTAGAPVHSSLDEISHLFIAGEDVAEKQMSLNVFISSILFRATPEDVRMLIIDSENRGLHVFNDIPHLAAPVITNVSQAVNALAWAVGEMERRYELLKTVRAKEIKEYNRFVNNQSQKLSHLIIIVDELADLMAVACQKTEQSVARLAQMAAVSGIHIVVATQTPSTDVLPGLFKAHFPTRISFSISSKTYSWIILDSTEAQTLLGNGDMLVWTAKELGLNRIHGAFITDSELDYLIKFWQKQTGSHEEDIFFSIPKSDKLI